MVYRNIMQVLIFIMCIFLGLFVPFYLLIPVAAILEVYFGVFIWIVIFGIPVFTLVILLRNSKRNNLNLTQVAKLLVFLVAIIVVLLYAIVPVSESINEFDSKVWRDHVQVRSLMIDDLIESELLLGMNEEDVINTLGEPSQRNGKALYYTLYLNQPVADHCVVRIEDDVCVSVSKH